MNNEQEYCGKVGYESREAAKKDIRQIEFSNRHFSKRAPTRKKGKKKHAYLCPRCRKWHITSAKWNSKGKKIQKALEGRG